MAEENYLQHTAQGMGCLSFHMRFIQTRVTSQPLENLRVTRPEKIETQRLL